MAVPGARNWWEMTGGELEDMNRTRCGDLPFGGRADPTCAQFRIESLGIGAPDTDENRTSEPSLMDRIGTAAINMGPIGPVIAGVDATASVAKNAVDKYLPNIVLILIGIVLIFAGIMLWSNGMKKIEITLPEMKTENKVKSKSEVKQEGPSAYATRRRSEKKLSPKGGMIEETNPINGVKSMRPRRASDD